MEKNKPLKNQVFIWMLISILILPVYVYSTGKTPDDPTVKPPKNGEVFKINIAGEKNKTVKGAINIDINSLLETALAKDVYYWNINKDVLFVRERAGTFIPIYVESKGLVTDKVKFGYDIEITAEDLEDAQALKDLLRDIGYDANIEIKNIDDVSSINMKAKDVITFSTDGLNEVNSSEYKKHIDLINKKTTAKYEVSRNIKGDNYCILEQDMRRYKIQKEVKN